MCQIIYKENANKFVFCISSVLCVNDLQGSEKSGIFVENNYLVFIAMNPLYKDIRGKVLTDFYSEYDLQMLGFSMEEFSIPKYSDYEKACSLYNAAQIIEDSDLMEAAEKLILEMQEKEGYGQE